MPFDPDKYLEEKQMSFDPDSYLKSKSDPEEPREISGLEALGRGAAQWGSFGLADETAGGIAALLDAYKKGTLSELGTDYGKARSEYEKADELAWQQRPGYYGTGAALGAVGSGLGASKLLAKAGLAGFQGARAMTQAESVADTLSKAKGLAALGGVGAAGASKAKVLENVPIISESNADDFRRELGQFTKDVGFGAATAPGIGIATEVAVPAALQVAKSAMSSAGKKLNNIVLGLPEDLSEKYYAYPQAINEAPTREQFAERLVGVLSGLKEESSPQAKKMLSSLSGERISAPGFDVSSAVRKLKSVGTKEASDLADELFSSEKQRALETVNTLTGGKVTSNPEFLNQQELYRVKRVLQDAGDFMSATPKSSKAIANQMSGEVNAALRASNPQYAALADEAAGLIRAKKDLASKFGLIADQSAPERLNYTDRTMSAIRDLSKENKVDRARVLDMLEQLGYGNLRGEAENVLAKEAFSGGAAQGSRRTLLGTVLGGTAGSFAAGPLGTAVGSSIGAGVGAAADKYGPQMAKRLIDISRTGANIVRPVIGGAASMAPVIGAPKISSELVKYLSPDKAPFKDEKQAAEEYQNSR